MAKNFFQHVEIVDLTEQKIEVKAPVFEVKASVPDNSSREEVLEKLKKEVADFRASWAVEKDAMIQNARDEAEEIKENARTTAQETFQNNAHSIDQSQKKAQNEADKIRADAKEEAKRVLAEAEAKRDELYEETRAQALKSANEEGWEKGQAEVKRLIDRLHAIIDSAIAKRQEIVESIEGQLIDLVLLIVRKVIKVISEKQENVVMHNITHALKKLKSRGDISIRVNLADLDITTRHIDDFLGMVENSSLKVLEDSSVDRGGAVIETDFGQIDARIHSQLREIEETIVSLVPIKTTEES